MTTAPEAEQATDRSSDETEGLLDGNLSRRRMMRNAALTAGTVVAAGAGLAACSTGGSDSSGGSGSSGSSSGGASNGGSTVLGKTSDIPVGGGVIYASDKVVVTQPTSGTFKGFSSTCTHLGCTVNKVADGLIQCPCHGSKYSVVDGSVKSGPAPKALPTENVSVQNGNVVLNS
jgi:Rieske Fe-S protein